MKSPPTDVTPLVRVRDLTKSYPAALSGSLLVLQSVSFDIRRGEIVGVVGESGSGKSTLLHLLGALDRPDSGDVLFEGDNIFAKEDSDLSKFRNQHVGFVFQFHHLLPEFTALENVAMPAIIQQRPLRQVRGRALELLDILGIADRADHRPHALSGGEQQRVAVARALMNAPRLVLADEPTGNLDGDTAHRLQEEIVRLSRDLEQTFVLATHSTTLAGMADRLLRLENHVISEEPAARRQGSDVTSGG
ncbi:MAG: ABC transporter ATP-binding protein [Rhodothermales bacterium]|nr:ABC transporter ATP-binding protein [Rhodothermales bacterium]